MQTSQIVVHNLNVQDLETIIVNAIKRSSNPILQTEALNSKQVQKMLGISHTTLQTWRDNGNIPFRKIGNKIFYQKSDVVSLLSSNKN